MELDASLRTQLSNGPESSFLYRIAALIANKLDDTNAAVEYYKKAILLNPDDPAPKYGLAQIYRESDTQALESISQELVKSGWGDAEKSGPSYAGRIWSLYLYALNVNENYTAVFEYTEKWRENIDIWPWLAVSRASAYRRLADLEHRKRTADGKRIGDLLGKAAVLLTEALWSAKFRESLLGEVKKLLSEFIFYSHKYQEYEREFTEHNKESIRTLFLHCTKKGHLLKLYSPDDIRILLGNKDHHAGASGQESIVHSSSLTMRGKVKINCFPDRQYTFVQDETGTDYFLHSQNFENGNPQNWRKLLPGVEVCFRTDPQANSDRAIRILEARLNIHP